MSGVALFDAIFDENRRKNIFHHQVSKIALPDFTYEEYMGDDASNRKWSFDSNGALVVTLPARFTAQQKAQIQAAADTRFGVGKVVIQ